MMLNRRISWRNRNNLNDFPLFCSPWDRFIVYKKIRRLFFVLKKKQVFINFNFILQFTTEWKVIKLCIAQ